MALSVFNVTDFDFNPDNATPAILRAVEAANAAGGGIIYFPALAGEGDYFIGDSDAADDRHVHIHGAHCLSFIGDGDCSVLRRDAGDPEAGIFLFTNCHDIVIARLAFDADGFEPPADSPQRALAQFELCKSVQIQDVLAMDRNPTPYDLVDPLVISHRYETAHHMAFGFYGDVTEEGSSDLAVEDCRLESLGMAVHGASRVWIANNTIIEARGNGIAVGARSTAQKTVDVTIAGNRVRDAWAFGIVVADLPAAGEEITMTTIRHVRVEDNEVVKHGDHYKRGIVVGPDPGSEPQAGSLPTSSYGTIWVNRNRVWLFGASQGLADDGSPDLAERAIVGGIWLQAPVPREDELTGATFGGWPRILRATITDNVVRGARSSEEDALPGVVQSPPGVGILATNLDTCEVGGNVVLECDDGMTFVGGLLFTHVHDNRVELASSAYRCRNSLGRNTFNSNVVMTAGDKATARGASWNINRQRGDRFLGGDRRNTGVVGLGASL